MYTVLFLLFSATKNQQLILEIDIEGITRVAKWAKSFFISFCFVFALLLI